MPTPSVLAQSRPLSDCSSNFVIGFPSTAFARCALTMFLHRRAGNRAVRTEYAAIARLWPEPHATSSAVVKNRHASLGMDSTLAMPQFGQVITDCSIILSEIGRA